MGFLFVGDFHLGAYPKGVPASYSYLKSIFAQLEEYALKHGYENIVQLGDLHDSVGVSEEDRIFYIEQFSKSKLNWKIYYGNHDFLDANYNTLSYYKRLQKTLGVLKNVEFYTEPTQTEIEGTKVAILPWPYNKVKSKVPLVCFGHFAAKGAKGDNGFSLKEGASISDKHYWLIGDLHTYQKGRYHTYIGSPLQLKYGDTPKRYFGVFEGRATRPNVSRIEIQLPYRLEQVVCTSIDDIGKMLADLKNRDPNVYSQLKLGAEVLADYRYEEIKAIPQTNIVFTGKVRKEDDTKDSVVLIDSKSVREDLVKKRLKKKGFDSAAIKKALAIIKSLETGV